MGTILVVEDDKVIINILRFFLERYGYGFTSAECAVSGLAMARETKPNVIIMDLMMPDVTGWEAIEMLRTDSELCHIPIIVLTALADTQSRNRALDAGADTYLSKPFRFFELKHKIDNLMNVSSNCKPGRITRSKLDCAAEETVPVMEGDLPALKAAPQPQQQDAPILLEVPPRHDDSQKVTIVHEQIIFGAGD